MKKNESIMVKLELTVPAGSHIGDVKASLQKELSNIKDIEIKNIEATRPFESRENIIDPFGLPEPARVSDR